MSNYYVAIDKDGNYILAHAGKWRQHKYIRKEGNRYIYPEDLRRGRTTDAVSRGVNKISGAKKNTITHPATPYGSDTLGSTMLWKYSHDVWRDLPKRKRGTPSQNRDPKNVNLSTKYDQHSTREFADSRRQASAPNGRINADGSVTKRITSPQDAKDVAKFKLAYSSRRASINAKKAVQAVSSTPMVRTGSFISKAKDLIAKLFKRK